MGKKINVDKPESGPASDEIEDILDPRDGAGVAEILDDVNQATASNIDVAKIIKSTGGIQAAVISAGPMIDQIGTQARLDAQRASAMAMKEYRRQLQTIVGSMQGTIREEGVRLAEQICARITTQIRQAVLLETEKKALNLVDEFVLGWQIEAESMSQDLLAVSAEPTAEIPSNKPLEKSEPVTTAKEESSMTEKSVKAVEATEKDTASLPLNPAAEKAPGPGPIAKKQPETASPERAKTEQSENEKKVVFDFATFIAQSKSPLKT